MAGLISVAAARRTSSNPVPMSCGRHEEAGQICRSALARTARDRARCVATGSARLAGAKRYLLRRLVDSRRFGGDSSNVPYALGEEDRGEHERQQQR